MRKWREQFRRDPVVYNCTQQNAKRLGLLPWILVVFMLSALFLSFTTASFAADEAVAVVAEEDGCTPEDIKDPGNEECLPAGETSRGEMFFTGAETFSKKGAPCVSCHNVSDTLSWGGGTLGPDLTGIVGRMSSDGLATILSSLSFPTMVKVYETKQLSKQEQADLLAFFTDANSRSASSFSSIQIWWGIGGFIVLLILQNIFWSNRFKGVRKQQIGGGN